MLTIATELLLDKRYVNTFLLELPPFEQRTNQIGAISQSLILLELTQADPFLSLERTGVLACNFTVMVFMQSGVTSLNWLLRWARIRSPQHRDLPNDKLGHARANFRVVDRFCQANLERLPQVYKAKRQ